MRTPFFVINILLIVFFLFETSCFGFSFGVVGGTGEEIESKLISQKIFNEIAMISPEFVINTGGIFNNTMFDFSNDFSRKMFEQYRKYGIKIHAVASPMDIENDQNAKEFKNYFGSVSKSFHFDNSFFILFNLVKRSSKNAVIEMEDYLWLVKEFEKSRKFKNCFLIIHFPILGALERYPGSYWEEQKWYKKILELIMNVPNLRYVIQGYEKLFSLRTKGEVNFMTSSGGGRPLEAIPADGGYFHYVIFNVEPDEITYNTYSPFGIDYKVYPENTGNRTKVKIIVSNVLCNELYATPFNGIRVLMPAAESYRVVTSNPTVKIRSLIPVMGRKKIVVLSMQSSKKTNRFGQHEEIILEVVR